MWPAHEGSLRASKDYYKLLGVDQGASEKDIKASYYKVWLNLQNYC